MSHQLAVPPHIQRPEYAAGKIGPPKLSKQPEIHDEQASAQTCCENMIACTQEQHVPTAMLMCWVAPPGTHYASNDEVYGGRSTTD